MCVHFQSDQMGLGSAPHTADNLWPGQAIKH